MFWWPNTWFHIHTYILIHIYAYHTSIVCSWWRDVLITGFPCSEGAARDAATVIFKWNAPRSNVVLAHGSTPTWAKWVAPRWSESTFEELVSPQDSVVFVFSAWVDREHQGAGIPQRPSTSSCRQRLPGLSRQVVWRDQGLAGPHGGELAAHAGSHCWWLYTWKCSWGSGLSRI